jgi:hypothetical protein
MGNRQRGETKANTFYTTAGLVASLACASVMAQIYAQSSPTRETKEGVSRLNRMLKSFLETNKVEKRIRSAADAEAIMFAVLIDAKELESSTPDIEDHGIIIFSTSRHRNLQMLIEAEDN